MVQCAVLHSPPRIQSALNAIAKVGQDEEIYDEIWVGGASAAESVAMTSRVATMGILETTSANRTRARSRAGKGGKNDGQVVCFADWS